MTTPEIPNLNPGNRAYQRFAALLSEHFDVADWHRNGNTDGVPIMTTVKDLPSGDLFTLALIDSLEETTAAVLLAIAQDGHLTAHGPFRGQPAAEHHAPRLALADADLAYTRACALHDPARQHVPVAAWTPVPTTILTMLRPAPVTATPAVLVLLDDAAERLAVVGAFPGHTSADRWHHAESHSTGRRVVPLHRPASLH